MTYEEQLAKMGLTQKFQEATEAQDQREKVNAAKAKDGYAAKVDGEFHYSEDTLVGIAFNQKNKPATKLAALRELEARGWEPVTNT